MAYGTKALAEPPYEVVDVFLARFGPDARVLTPLRGLIEHLNDAGELLEKSSWGYGSSFSMTAATFEVSLVLVDRARLGLFVATDED